MTAVMTKGMKMGWLTLMVNTCYECSKPATSWCEECNAPFCDNHSVAYDLCEECAIELAQEDAVSEYEYQLEQRYWQLYHEE